jgi:GT2 family glycosyltransferase
MTTASSELPIRVVCATRLRREEFFGNSPTGRSLAALRITSPIELALYATNTAGLGEVYNQAIEQCAAQPRILVFVHDDCLIADFYWAERVRQGLREFEIVGVVGNRRRVPRQRSWIILDSSGRQDDPINLSGAVGQGLHFPPQRLDVFGAARLECKLLDGVFLASSSETLHARGLRFDPRFSFHFYDMDFCRSAEQLGCRMGTIPLSLVHASEGALDDAWMSAYRAYLAKWSE